MVIVISVSLCVYNDIVNGRDIPNWSSSSGVLTRAVGLESSSAYVVVGLEDELDEVMEVLDDRGRVADEGEVELEEVEELGRG